MEVREEEKWPGEPSLTESDDDTRYPAEKHTRLPRMSFAKTKGEKKLRAHTVRSEATPTRLHTDDGLSINNGNRSSICHYAIGLRLRAKNAQIFTTEQIVHGR